MIVKAYQTAFHREGDVKIRPVVVEDELVAGAPTIDILERAFQLGQNDFVPLKGFYSVSVGDVLEIPGRGAHRVLGAGFEELDPGEDPAGIVGRHARVLGQGF
jgi:hypothetical protein